MEAYIFLMIFEDRNNMKKDHVPKDDENTRCIYRTWGGTRAADDSKGIDRGCWTPEKSRGFSSFLMYPKKKKTDDEDLMLYTWQLDFPSPYTWIYKELECARNNRSRMESITEQRTREKWREKMRRRKIMWIGCGIHTHKKGAQCNARNHFIEKDQEQMRGEELTKVEAVHWTRPLLLHPRSSRSRSERRRKKNCINFTSWKWATAMGNRCVWLRKV